MRKYVVWTNVTDKKTVEAKDSKEAAARYHQGLGAFPDGWDGALHVRDMEYEEEWTYRRREAA